jgi:hypothetical protein
MIPASDLWMLGLKARPTRRGLEFVPTSGAAQPLRELGELFTGSVPTPAPRGDKGRDRE